MFVDRGLPGDTVEARVSRVRRTWAEARRDLPLDAEPFEIPMHGLGLFACRKEAWPGFNPRLSGFGGEEGYLHQKIRNRGGRVYCMPFLRWMLAEPAFAAAAFHTEYLDGLLQQRGGGPRLRAVEERLERAEAELAQVAGTPVVHSRQ